MYNSNIATKDQKDKLAEYNDGYMVIDVAESETLNNKKDKVANSSNSKNTGGSGNGR